MSAAASTQINFVSTKASFEPKFDSLNRLGSASLYVRQKSPVQCDQEKCSKLSRKRTSDVVDGLKIKRSISESLAKYDDEDSSYSYPVFDCSEDRDVAGNEGAQKTPLSALRHYIDEIFISNFEEDSSPSSTSSSSSFESIQEVIIEPCHVTEEESAASFTTPITSEQHALEPFQYRDSYMLVFTYGSSSTARGWKLDAEHYVFEFDISGTPYYVTAPENGGFLSLTTNAVAPSQIVNFSSDRRVFKRVYISATDRNGLQSASDPSYWIDYSTGSKRFAKVSVLEQQNVKDISFESG